MPLTHQNHMKKPVHEKHHKRKKKKRKTKEHLSNDSGNIGERQCDLGSDKNSAEDGNICSDVDSGCEENGDRMTDGRQASAKNTCVKPEPEVPNKSRTHIKQNSKVNVTEVDKQVTAATKTIKPPESKPTAVCFDIKGSVTCHAEVFNTVRELLRYSRGCRVDSVQFLPKGRWVITTDSPTTRNRLIGMAATVADSKILLRRYDDVVMLEYQRSLRTNGLMNIVNNKK